MSDEAEGEAVWIWKGREQKGEGFNILVALKIGSMDEVVFLDSVQQGSAALFGGGGGLDGAGVCFVLEHAL